MNQCHSAKLYLATLLAPAKAVFAQAPVQAEIASAEPAPSTLIEMFVSATVVAKTKKFFKKLKKATKTAKADNYYFETIIESMNCDFTYADKKVWWSVQ